MAFRNQTHATTPFRSLVTVVEAVGSGQGLPATVQLYADWIAAQPAAARDLHRAWFNLGTELNHAGAPADAMRAYRAALTIDPTFFPASQNLGLLLGRTSRGPAARPTPTHSRGAGADTGRCERLPG